MVEFITKVDIYGTKCNLNYPVMSRIGPVMSQYYGLYTQNRAYSFDHRIIIIRDGSPSKNPDMKTPLVAKMNKES